MNKIVLNMKTLDPSSRIGSTEMPRELICPLMRELFMWCDNLPPLVQEKIAEIHADPYVDLDSHFGGVDIELYLFTQEGRFSELPIAGSEKGIYKVRDTMNKLLVMVGLAPAPSVESLPESLSQRRLPKFLSFGSSLGASLKKLALPFS